MATVARILTRWAGGPSAPGLTVMSVRYTSGAIQPSLDAVRAFWLALQANVPAAYTLSVDVTADTFNVESGALTGSITGTTTPATVTGSGVASYAAGVGGRITWSTGAIAHGHRVKGRTFIVPLVNGAFDTVGTMLNTYITTANSAAATLISSLNTAGTPLAVWTKKTTTGPHAGDGVLSDVIAGVMPDEVAVLVGRRKA